MGDYSLEFKAVGGHGCDRTAKEGEAINVPKEGCECPDCKTARFVDDMKQSGGLQSAIYTHWPGLRGEVVDDLVAKKRVKGSF